MKKIVVIITVLALATLACGLQRVTPTPVPPPTQAPLPTQAPAQPTLAPLPTQPSVPASGNLLFVDNFTSGSPAWGIRSDAEYTREFRDGTLVMGIVPPLKDAWTALDKSIDEDVQIEVDAVKLTGSSFSDFGVICGMQDDRNFFALTAGPNGLVEIFKFVDGVHTEILLLENQTALVDGPNHLSATCQGSTLTLVANGQQVATVTDTSLKPGYTGVIIGTFDEGNLSYAFDNFAVFGLGTQGSAVLPPPTQPGLERGDLLYSDDFSDTGSGWDVYEGTGYSGDGRYRILVENTEWEAFGNPYQYFADGVIIEVDATVTQGHAENGFGVICGYQDIEDFFALLVGTHGYAEIVRYTADGRTMVQEAWNVPTNPDTNHLTAKCGGNELVLYVNGAEALRTTHPDLQGGDVGLIAGSFATTPVEIYFDNLMVYQAR